MTIGPLELLVMRYDGGRVDDAIGRELGALEHAHSVRVVDLALVTRTADTPAETRRVREMTEEELRPFEGATGDLMGLLGDDELDRVGAALPPDTTAVVALVEHTWATGLRDAVRRSGGVLVMDELLAPEVVEALNAELREFEVIGE
jgi:Family of unknown function (DUF6325)